MESNPKCAVQFTDYVVKEFEVISRSGSGDFSRKPLFV